MKKKKYSQGKVLVLGEGTRSFLSIIRSLGRKGIIVHVGWFSYDDPALRSKYVSQILDLPPYSNENEKWKDVLIRILQRERYDLVIPCIDQTIIALQQNKTELTKYANIYLLSDESFKIVNNKIETNNLARKLNISLPRETIYQKNDPVNLNNLINFFGLPIVIKPISSFSNENLRRKQFVKKAYNKSQLTNYLNKYDKVLLQENFIGTGVGVEILASNGKILTSFQHLRIHEPLMGGGSSYRKSEKIYPELFKASSNIIKALNYTGVAMIEFKYNTELKKWVLIEINGRFWGSLPLAIVSGIDFPYYLFELLIKNKEKFNQTYKQNIYCRNLIKDMIWIWRNFRTNKSDRTLNTLPNLKVVSEIKNLISFKERSDTIVIDDLLPGFYEIFKILLSILNSLKNKIQIKLYSIFLFRRINQKKVRKKLRDLNSILFICKGNICRSPFAVSVAKLIFPKSIKISSRGTLFLKNRNPPIAAIETACELGYEIRDHKSKILKKKNLQNSDIIFIFDQLNYSDLIKKYPEFKKKIFYLGILDGERIVIKDPFGKNKIFYKEIYSLIIRNIKQLSDEYYKVN